MHKFSISQTEQVYHVILLSCIYQRAFLKSLHHQSFDVNKINISHWHISNDDKEKLALKSHVFLSHG